jgi:hypothetical protein
MAVDFGWVKIRKKAKRPKEKMKGRGKQPFRT